MGRIRYKKPWTALRVPVSDAHRLGGGRHTEESTILSHTIGEPGGRALCVKVSSTVNYILPKWAASHTAADPRNCYNLTTNENTSVQGLPALGA